jgi:hypothetical protein
MPMPPIEVDKEYDESWAVAGPRFSSFGEAPLELRWESLRMSSWQA